MRSETAIRWVMFTMLLFFGILWAIPISIAMIRTLGFPISSVSDYIAIAALGVSVVTLISSLVWNMWVFEKTGDIYQPVLEFHLKKHRHDYVSSKYEIQVVVENKGASNSIPSQVLFEPDWLDDPVPYEPDVDYLPPKGSTQLTSLFETPGLGRHQLRVVWADEEAGIRWWDDLEFETRSKRHISVKQ